MARHITVLALIFLAVAALASAENSASSDAADSPAESILTPYAMSPGVDDIIGDPEASSDSIPDDSSAAQLSPSGSTAAPEDDANSPSAQDNDAKSVSDYSPSNACTIGLSSMAAASVAVAASYFIF